MCVCVVCQKCCGSLILVQSCVVLLWVGRCVLQMFENQNKIYKKKRKELILIGSHDLCDVTKGTFPEMHIALHCDCETTLTTGGVYFAQYGTFLASRHQLSLSPPSRS